MGKDLNRKVHNNDSRGALITKDRCISDYIIDGPVKGDPTLSSIVADCVRFESEWAKCPIAPAAVNSIPPDRMIKG